MNFQQERGNTRILPPTPQTAALSESLTLILVGGCGRTRGQGISGLTTFSCRMLTATRHLWRRTVAQLTTHTHTRARAHARTHTPHTHTHTYTHTHKHTQKKQKKTHMDNYSLSLACSGRSISLLPPRDDSDTPSLHGMQVPHSHISIQTRGHCYSSIHTHQVYILCSKQRMVITIRHIK